MMKQLFLRITLLIPWVFLIWLIGQGIAGEISALLVFVLLFILIPATIVLNLFTVLAFQGHAVFKVMKQVQTSRDVGNQKLESENYADLPWWNPKKYK